MIADEHEYQITCRWAKCFQEAVDKFDDSPRKGVSRGMRQIIRAGLEAKLSDLLEEIAEYKRLKADPTAKPKPKEPNPFNPAAAYCQRGLRRRDKGDLDAAIADFDEAIRLQPKLVEAWYHRGVAKGMKGDLDGAIADFSEAIRIDPDDANAWCNRGVAKGMKGDHDGAIADLNEAIRFKPDYVKAWVNRGIAKNKKRDFNGAISDYNEAIRLQPNHAAFIRNREIALTLKAAEVNEEKIKEMMAQLQSYMHNTEPGHPAERIAAFG